MMTVRNLLALFLVVMISSCGGTTKPKKQQDQGEPAKKEKSKHDRCDKSMGEMWSEMMNSCVWLQDEAKLMRPIDEPVNAAIVAYALFPDFDSSQIEIFLPLEVSTVILQKETDIDAWSGANFRLVADDNGLTLSRDGIPEFKQ